MRRNTFLDKSPARAEHILAIIRDDYRHAKMLDPEAELDVDLTFGSTVAEWRDARNLRSFKGLWPALNTWFKISFDAPEWREALEPARSKKLRGVCELIAEQAMLPVIRPLRVAGTECRSAGAFLTLRSLLLQEGVPVHDIRPSTALTAYAREHGRALMIGVGKLAPGALPVPTVESRAFHSLSWKVLVAGFFLLLPCFEWHFLFSAVAIVLGAGWFGVWISSRYPPKTVTFGDLVTFRNLTEAILAFKSS